MAVNGKFLCVVISGWLACLALYIFTCIILSCDIMIRTCIGGDLEMMMMTDRQAEADLIRCPWLLLAREMEELMPHIFCSMEQHEAAG